MEALEIKRANDEREIQEERDKIVQETKELDQHRVEVRF
jgi:hypothetical protein